MNKQRRKELRVIKEKLVEIINEKQNNVNLDAIKEILEDIESDLGCLYDDEVCCMDNIPENLQESIRYEKAEAACDNLESAVDYIGDAVSSNDFEEIIITIKKAINFINAAVV